VPGQDSEPEPEYRNMFGVYLNEYLCVAALTYLCDVYIVQSLSEVIMCNEIFDCKKCDWYGQHIETVASFQLVDGYRIDGSRCPACGDFQAISSMTNDFNQWIKGVFAAREYKEIPSDATADYKAGHEFQQRRM